MGSLPNVKSTVLEAQDLLASARQLREKIKKHDDCATDLLLRGRSVQRREAAVQELHTALDAHSAVPFLRATRTTVLRELHHERRVLQALRQEHDELLEAVHENGDAVQYVMRKYRQHSQKLCDLATQDAACPLVMERYLCAVVRSNVEDLEDMLALSQQAVCRDDAAAVLQSQALQEIAKENVAFRSALNIFPQPLSRDQITESLSLIFP